MLSAARCSETSFSGATTGMFAPTVPKIRGAGAVGGELGESLAVVFWKRQAATIAKLQPHHKVVNARGECATR
jgi:hypothetical protein